MTVATPDLSQAGLEAALRKAVVAANAARAAYDKSVTVGNFDPERNRQLGRDIERADSLMCSLGKQILTKIIGDRDYEPRVTIRPDSR